MLSTYSCLYVVLTGAGQLSKPLEHNKLQVMGSSAESDQHNKRNLLPGIKSTTERTPTNRNNTSDMLPENNTGKDVEITERTQALKGTKQYRTPNNKMRISKATLDNYPTNKVDPTIGSTRRENRDRNPVGKPEIPLTTSSISKSNGSEHSRLTKEKEQDDTKQADKINPSELSLMHNKAPLPETTQKPSTTETTLGDTSPI